VTRWAPGPRAAVLAAAVAAALALPGCSGPGAVERTVTLTVHHSQFSVTDLHVRPGETVRFVVVNADPIGHELIVGDQAVQDAHEIGTDASHQGRPGEISVPPGSTGVTTYRFGPSGGGLLFGCHLPGHWAYGMHGTIQVG
jgi:uncharacterized cupredoxin-like copper-binding protein